MTFNTVLKPTSTASIIGGGFKPCYKWMTFNTKELSRNRYVYIWRVLNLVINGWPSILATINDYVAKYYGVLNLVINGWPSILDSNYSL